jgi:PAS domain-containing protein
MRTQDFDGTFDGYLERVHPADRGPQRRGLERLLEEGESATSEYRILRGDGAERRIRSRVVVERELDGTPRRLLGVCTDITDDADRPA